jgi:hypothetical protein
MVDFYDIIILDNVQCIQVYYLGQEGKRPLGRPGCKWVDNIKMDLSDIGWDVMGWIDLAQDKDQWRALVNTVMELRVL